MLSMITIGVGCTAEYALSKRSLISITLNLCLFADRDHVDAHVHADKGVGRTEIGAVQRDSLTRIARHRNTHQVAGADDAVGGIELDPAGARQKDLDPSMGRRTPTVPRRTCTTD